jgi:hypothetical protein
MVVELVHLQVVMVPDIMDLMVHLVLFVFYIQDTLVVGLQQILEQGKIYE